jgi:hypothetical protein
MIQWRTSLSTAICRTVCGSAVSEENQALVREVEEEVGQSSYTIIASIGSASHDTRFDLFRGRSLRVENHSLRARRATTASMRLSRNACQEFATIRKSCMVGPPCSMRHPLRSHWALRTTCYRATRVERRIVENERLSLSLLE